MQRIFALIIALTSLLGPWGAVAATGLPIVVYHEIVPDPMAKPAGATVISLARFAEQMQYLADQGYRTLSMPEAVRAIASGDIPERAIAIHFDDGWASQQNALPILERHGFKATFWIIADAVPEYGYFTPDDTRRLAEHPLFEVQSHTLTHPWNPKSSLLTWADGSPAGKSLADVRRELAESKRLLEARLGRPVPYLAWPCGWYDDRLVALAQEAGYRALATIDPGLNLPGGDVLRIRRAIIDGNCSLEDFVRTLASPRHQFCSPSPIQAAVP